MFLLSGYSKGENEQLSISLVNQDELGRARSQYERILTVHVYSLSALASDDKSSNFHVAQLVRDEFTQFQNTMSNEMYSSSFKSSDAKSSIENSGENGYVEGQSAQFSAEATSVPQANHSVQTRPKKAEKRNLMSASSFFSKKKKAAVASPPKAVVASPPRASSKDKAKRKVTIESEESDDENDPFSVQKEPTASAAAGDPSVVETAHQEAATAEKPGKAKPAKRSNPVKKAPKTVTTGPADAFTSGARPNKKKKKVLKERTFQNDKGYFVTESIMVEVTDDEEDATPAPAPIVRQKRKDPPKARPSQKKKGAKKQKSLAGFFSMKKTK